MIEPPQEAQYPVYKIRVACWESPIGDLSKIRGACWESP